VIPWAWKESYQSQASSKGYNKRREDAQVYFCFLGRSITSSFSSKNAGRRSRRRKLCLTVSPLVFCQDTEITPQMVWATQHLPFLCLEDTQSWSTPPPAAPTHRSDSDGGACTSWELFTPPASATAF